MELMNEQTNFLVISVGKGKVGGQVSSFSI